MENVIKSHCQGVPPRLLTIAGSDSGGGAGVQADLQTFQELGGYGMSAITALTAQNTVNVKSIFPISSSFVKDQIECVIEDIGVDAIKIGMIHDASIIETVSQCLSKYDVPFVVLDPVMVAKSGDHLLKPNAIEALRELLIPRVHLLTPNIPELEILSSTLVGNLEDAISVSKHLLKSVPSVLVKGGHLPLPVNTVIDTLIQREKEAISYERVRVKTPNSHGTGCTFSAAICAFVAKGESLELAVSEARDYVQGAILSASHWVIGKGHGPLDHGFKRRPCQDAIF